MLRDNSVMDNAKLNSTDEQGGQAAGLFANLGSYAGHALGSMADGAAHDLLSGFGLAGGQFGSASGQFGSAAGQFGSASGQFGGNMTKRSRYEL